MKKKLPYTTIIVCTVIVALYFAIYTVLTPFIRGKVIDAQTGKTVDDAWVTAIAGIDTRTIAGDVGSSYAISRHHLRTGKGGVFTIFPKMYFSIPTPFSFGNKSRELNITVRVKDGKRAEMDLTKNWWKRVLVVTVPVKQGIRKDEVINYELSDLAAYCIRGKPVYRYRTGNELCDNWELEYTIIEYEKLIKNLKDNKNRTTDQDTYLSMAMHSLGFLYKQQGNLEKALELFRSVNRYDQERGVPWGIAEQEFQIKEIEEKLSKKY